MSSADPVERALLALRALHDEIDFDVAQLTKIHLGRLSCRRGCSACCSDDLSVTRIEAENIRLRNADLIRHAAPHPIGACAFLDQEGACRIYEDRPTICRSQGLPLRVIVENEREEIEERRDICPLNLDGGPPLETLSEESCWLVGPHELRARQLEESAFGHDDDADERIALRDLFTRS